MRFSAKTHFVFSLLLLVAALAVLALMAYRREPSNSPATLPLSSDARSLHFGESVESTAMSVSFSFKNSTDAPLYIAKFATSCGCTKVSPEAITVAAGESVRCNAVVDTTGSVATNASPLDKRYVITPVDGDGRALQRPWAITGRITPAFVFSKSKIDLGRVAVATRIDESLVVTPHRAVGPVTVSVDDDRWSCEVAPDGDRSILIRLTAARPLIVGNINFNIVVAPSDPDSHVPIRRVPVVGFVASSIDMAPPALIFNEQRTGSCIDAKLHFLSIHDGGTAAVLNAPPGMRVESGTAAAGHLTVHLSQKVMRSGCSDSKLIIAVTDPVSGISHFSVPFVYCGVD